MIEYGLLGEKLGHSFSPQLHKALAGYDYGLLPTPPGQVEDLFRRREFKGLNVTIPYKRTVIPLCDEVDPRAAAIGAVNTVVNRDGTLIGCNTDIDGLIYLARRAGVDMAGKKAVILGSGGTSRTAQAAARELGAAEIAVISRQGEDNYENLSRHEDAQVLINTTPVGMWPHMDGAPVDLRRLPGLTDVADVIYNPGRTDLLLQAEALGLRHAGGLSMLVHQAKRAEELFFDKPIPDGETEAITARLWREMTNLVLVGMPGSGKTTVGKLLAERSGKSFVDLDGEIARRAGMSIPEMFASQGEGPFRQLEHEVLTEACAKSGQIIATGGGAVLREENRAAMRRTGRVYRLRRRLEDLPTEGRPLSQAGKLEEMERLRDPLYAAAADREIWNVNSPAETAGEIWRDFYE